ncbi:MAG TPA: adenylate/guanylate cyclase domain-containing protein [Candidatus Saccharimonadales bacterium]|nr:adenylate/guanylate cyclase domain-containing protein [Candidatus Saccharimonadales bacterium]
MRFCGQCGIALAFACPRCAAEMPAGFDYCGKCGTRLMAEAADGAGETRQVTVLFADISGFTALAERLGPAELHDNMRAAWDVIADEIRANGGLIEKYIGDAVVAVFGAVGTVAVDHPEQAQRAALDIVAALDSTNAAIAERTGRRLALRIGLNTGIALAGTIGDRQSEFGVLGDAVNVAARLEQAAESGEILIGDATYRRTPGLFVYEPHPPIVAKGKSAPLVAWRLIGSAAQGADGILRMPLVGRDAEMAALTAALEAALAERGALVSVVGEAGLGKSRLVDELLRDPRTRGARVARVRCSAYGTHRPYGAVTDLLRRILGLAGTASADHAFRTITETYPEIEPEVRALVLAALGYGVALPPMSGETKRRLLDRGFAGVLLRVAQAQGLVAAIEDLQWIDASSLGFLTRFGPSLTGSRALVLLSHRGDFVAPWASTREHVQIRLRPLDDAAMRWLVATLVPSDSVGTDIAAAAGGNPAYGEEAVRWLREGGVIVAAGQGAALVDMSSQPALPDSLPQLLLRRVDAIPAADRRILHAASVIGRSFDAQLVRSLYSAEVDVDGALARSADAGIIDVDANGTHRFHQTLLRDVVYGAMLTRHREELHGRVGLAIENARPEVAVQQPSLLALHFAASSHTLRAIDYAFRAADRALELHDLDAALHHYRLAASLALRLPDGGSAERARALLFASDAATRLGSFDEALIALEEAIASGLPEDDLRAALRRRAGALAARAGMIERAAEHLADAERLTPSFGTERSELTLAKAALARADDRASEALAIARVAVREAQSAGDQTRELEAEEAVVAYATEAGQGEDVRRALVRCADLAARLGDLPGLVRTLAAQTASSLDRGAAGEAERLGLELLATAARVGDVGGQASALRALARAHELFGRSDEIERSLQRALALADPAIPEAAREAGAAATLLALGRAALRRPDLGLAATTLEEARVLSPGAHERDHLAALVSAELARVAVARGEHERARDHAAAATAAQIAHRCRRCAAEIAPALVEVALAIGDQEGAESARATGLEAAYRLNLPIAIAAVRLAGGRLLAARADTAGARREYKAALETFERSGPLHLVAETRAALVGLAQAGAESA